MKASFVIRWHTRRIDNLLQTLRFLELWNPIVKECEAILVCHDKSWPIATPFGQTRCINLQSPEMHNAKQTNIGVSHTSCDKVVLLDGDRILPPDYFTKVFELLTDKVMITTTNMRKLTFFHTDKEIIANTIGANHEHRTIAEVGTRCCWSGSTAFRKKDFYEAGGMDEAYIGYGWEDTDMARAMLQIGVKPIMRPETELHLFHEGYTYGQKDQKKLFIQNGMRFCKKWGVRPYPPILANEITHYSRILI